MNIFDIVEKVMSTDDKYLISNISNYDFNKLVDDISRLSADELNMIFSSEKLIKNLELNKKGLHIFRCLLSERVADSRRNILGYDKHDYYQSFIEDGIIVIEDFMDSDNWDIIKEQANINKPYHLNLSTHQPFQDLIKLTTSMPIDYPSLGTEHLIHIDNDRQFVPEFLHSDIFQTSIKIWYYLEDVSLEKGPFSYVYKSHRKNKYMLEWWYKMSCIACDVNHQDFEKYIYRDSSDKNNWDFSPCLKSGATEEEINIELEKLNLPKITRLNKKENTLIIVDTSGFHGRGKAKAGMTRFSLRGGIRENPFLYFN